MNTDICGTCGNFDPNNVTINDCVGEIHVCKKGYICEPWNFHNGCKDYKENNVKQPFEQKDSDSELNKVLEFLCKIAKEKDIHIDFSPVIYDSSFPTFKVIQYRTNPKNSKTYKVTQMIDIDDLRIKNVTFNQVIDEIVRQFDDQFNDMFKEA